MKRISRVSTQTKVQLLTPSLSLSLSHSLSSCIYNISGYFIKWIYIFAFGDKYSTQFIFISKFIYVPFDICALYRFTATCKIHWKLLIMRPLFFPWHFIRSFPNLSTSAFTWGLDALHIQYIILLYVIFFHCLTCSLSYYISHLFIHKHLPIALHFALFPFGGLFIHFIYSLCIMPRYYPS